MPKNAIQIQTLKGFAPQLKVNQRTHTHTHEQFAQGNGPAFMEKTGNCHDFDSFWGVIKVSRGRFPFITRVTLRKCGQRHGLSLGFGFPGEAPVELPYGAFRRIPCGSWESLQRDFGLGSSKYPLVPVVGKGTRNQVQPCWLTSKGSPFFSNKTQANMFGWF